MQTRLEVLLQRVNQVYVARGCDTLPNLIPGVPHDPERCLVARPFREIALLVEVGGYTIHGPRADIEVIGRAWDRRVHRTMFDRNRCYVIMPFIIRGIPASFDRGRYPELELSAELTPAVAVADRELVSV